MAETVGHYALIEQIGTGALGALHRARDTKTGRTVALRIIDPAIAGDASRREALERALHKAATLSHPNVAALYEVGEDSGRRFYVQEFVPGITLDRIAEGQPLNVRRAVAYAIDIADALAEAEAIDVHHEHLSPANVIVTPQGRARLLDVGFAGWTRSGGARPEPDVVAVGRLLNVLVEGQVARSQVTMPGALASVIARCLENGYVSPATTAAALRDVAGALESSPRSEADRRVPRQIPWGPIVVVLALIAVAGVLIWLAIDVSG